MNQEKSDNPTLIRSILSTEVKWGVSVAFFVFGIAGPYYGLVQDIALIQKDISNINSNHEAHIQDIMQQIKDMQTKQLNQQDQIIVLQQQLLAALKR